MSRGGRWKKKVLLLSLAGLTACGPDGAVPEAQRTGARLFDANCTACHQQNAQGIPGVYPSLAGSPIVLGDPKPMVRWIVKGVRPASMPAGRFGTVMPQFAWMKDTDAAALVTFLRSNFGNHASPVDPATAAQALGE